MTYQEMRAKYSALLEEGAGLLQIESPTEENRTRMTAIMAEQRDLSGRIAQHDEIERGRTEERNRAEAEERARAAGRPVLPNPGEQLGEERGLTQAQREERGRQHESAYRHYMRTGDATQLRAMNIAVGANGGYSIATTLSPEVDTAILAYAGVAASVHNITTDSGAPIAFDTSNDTGNYAVSIAEGTQAGEQDIPFAQRLLQVDTLTTKAVLVSRQLLQDSSFDIVSFVQSRLAERAGRGLSKKVAGAASDAYFDSIIAAAVAGPTSEGPTAVDLNDIYGLYKGVDPGYSANGSFVMNQRTQVTMSAMRNDLGAPIFQLDGSGLLTTLLGKKVVIDPNLPDIAAGNRAVLFGDLSKYTLRKAGGLEIFRIEDSLALNYQVGFVGFFRAGGILLNAGTNPIQALVQHA